MYMKLEIVTINPTYYSTENHIENEIIILH
jgi:hypothetical protein